METALIIILFTLISGSFAYTYKKSESHDDDHEKMWDAIKELRHNDVKHLEERVKKLEDILPHEED